mmetsp:Transcript_21973/g.38816  ORF Transcript_21973/g.38816 Transcript_21973/m.38816 type:complete len:172 (-) Transcript_21973:111-626(-)
MPGSASTQRRMFPSRIYCQSSSGRAPKNLQVSLQWCIRGCTRGMHSSMVVCRGGHDVLLFMSRFEAWGMPVMEAMASGIAVVCSYSYGVQHFATDQENCLMVPSRDVPATAVAVLRLLRDNDMRKALASRGRQTALSYSLQGVGDSLERALMSTAAFFEKCPHPPQLPRYR